MQPKMTEKYPQSDLFRSRLENIINMRHELVKLAHSISWEFLDSKVASFYSVEGRPGIPSRLMVGLHILKQMYNLSDEAVCERWVHDPYFQYFCGETYFQHTFPIERSSMTHFRKRVGEEFCISLLQESLHTAHQLGAIKTEHKCILGMHQKWNASAKEKPTNLMSLAAKFPSPPTSIERLLVILFCTPALYMDGLMMDIR